MSGQPVGGLAVTAKPDRAVEGCPPLESTTSPDGAITFGPTCPRVRYEIETRDPQWRLTSPAVLVGGTIPTEEARLYVRAAVPAR